MNLVEKLEHHNQELHFFFFARVYRTVTKVTLLYVMKKVSTKLSQSLTGLKSFGNYLNSKIKLEINNKIMRTFSNVCMWRKTLKICMSQMRNENGNRSEIF